tara:strand:- start:1162 stop:1893 length:732 start_codon:yes stop_codon:yes gene_type:complete
MSEEEIVTVDEIISTIGGMSAQERQIFFERLGQMAVDWFPSRAAVTDIMFPTVRNNQRHVNALTLCREFVEQNGYITRSHVSHIIGDMDASTFRRAIIKKLIDEGAISDSNRKWKRNGQGQAHKVYRDNTNRYQSLFNDQPTRVSTDSNSIVKEPQKTAEKFVKEVLTQPRALTVGYPLRPGLIAALQRLGYTDVSEGVLKSWCEVVKQEVNKQKNTIPELNVYNIFNGKITVKTSSGVIMNE